MAKIIQVKLGEYRPVFLYSTGEVNCNRDNFVIIEVDRGQEFGKVVSDTEAVCQGKGELAEGTIVRIATDGDLKAIEQNRLKAKEAMATCIKKISECKLEMQVIQCEYIFDASKVVFYFTSEGRVDFRELVKDLAKVFKVRIELKQIGVRDKAKIVGGLGICGRGLCCSSYMKSFHPLSIKMSKEQNLPLHESRISGVCGRIKCCMAYEYLVYREYAKELPRAGEKITTPDGKGKVIEVNILKRFVNVDLGEGKIQKVSFAIKDEG